MNKDINSLPMTLEEIKEFYISARFKHKQIGILADMNVCSRATVIKALKAAGLSENELPGEARKDNTKQKEKSMKKILPPDVPNSTSGRPEPDHSVSEIPKAEPADVQKVPAVTSDQEAPAADPLLFATVPLMMSQDYKQRFAAEYRQLKIGYERLRRFTARIEAADITNTVTAPKYDCPYALLREQQDIMDRYLHTLELRAAIEGIDLERN